MPMIKPRLSISPGRAIMSGPPQGQWSFGEFLMDAIRISQLNQRLVFYFKDGDAT